MSDDIPEDDPSNELGTGKVVELRPGKKRKRLSTIDLLPADVRAELNMAIEEGRLRVDDLWALVREKGGDVSRSAVARYKVREEQHMAAFRKSQQMAEYFAREREKDPTGPASQLNNEIVKSLMFQRLMAISPKDAEKASSKDLTQLANAVRAAAATDKITLERENMIAKRAVEKERRQQEAALKSAVKKGDLNKEAAEQARRILGFAT